VPLQTSPLLLTQNECVLPCQSYCNNLTLVAHFVSLSSTVSTHLKKLGTMSNHSNRLNYKAKYLAALKASEKSPVERERQIDRITSAASNTIVDATHSLSQVSHATFEAAAVAKKVTSLLNEFRHVGDLDLGDTSHGIDEKLTEMPLPITLRRVRDILKICEFRIGVLSVSYEETHSNLLKSEENVERLTESLKPLQSGLVSSTWIGPRPSSTELEDYKDSRPGEYNRHGITYADLSDDWYDVQMANGSIIRQNASGVYGVNTESDEDEESSDDEAKTAMVKRMSNRSAAIIPTAAKKPSISDKFSL
jgi:hypothetical protein